MGNKKRRSNMSYRPQPLQVQKEIYMEANPPLNELKPVVLICCMESHNLFKCQEILVHEIQLEEYLLVESSRLVEIQATNHRV